MSPCTPVTNFTQGVNASLVKQPLIFNGGLAKDGSTSLGKLATVIYGAVTSAVAHHLEKHGLASLAKYLENGN